jgi:hypothetical protein
MLVIDSHLCYLLIIIYTIKRCSKGARGLPVYSQRIRIFTDNSISLSLSWRQCESRYTIHAGRNLPDKEFRYLRTVRVTAAVYWGFNSMLTHLLLTFQHRAGVRPYTSFCNFAESCVFAKQSLSLSLYHLILFLKSKIFFIPKLQN